MYLRPEILLGKGVLFKEYGTEMERVHESAI